MPHAHCRLGDLLDDSVALVREHPHDLHRHALVFEHLHLCIEQRFVLGLLGLGDVFRELVLGLRYRFVYLLRREPLENVDKPVNGKSLGKRSRSTEKHQSKQWCQ
jgi:hypothetical protein